LPFGNAKLKQLLAVTFQFSVQQNADKHRNGGERGPEYETQYYTVMALTLLVIVAEPHEFLDGIICGALQIGPRQAVKGLATPVNHCSNLLLIRNFASGMPM
jgi:hypothetical protein